MASTRKRYRHTIKDKNKDIQGCQKPRALLIPIREQVYRKLGPTLLEIRGQFLLRDLCNRLPRSLTFFRRIVCGELIQDVPSRV